MQVEVSDLRMSQARNPPCRWPLKPVEAGDHIDPGWINAWIVLVIVFNHRNPQGGVQGLGCKMLQPNGGHTSLVEDVQGC